MQSIAPQVIEGFNDFIEEQAADGADAVVSLIQFDSVDPHEVVADGSPIHDILDLDRATFQPRGSTPLFDAIGLVIGRAEGRVEQRRQDCEDSEDITVVIVTDGMENASREFTLTQVRSLIEKKQDEDDWGFVYLSADLAAYEDAAAMGFDQRSVSLYAADGQGAGAAFASLSKSAIGHRTNVRAMRAVTKKDFFAGDKSAERDRRRRHSASAAPTKVFLYGTLMPGESRWHLVEPFVTDHCPAVVRGRLYDTGRGFPAARFDQAGQVEGVLATITPGHESQLLAALRAIGGGLYRIVRVTTDHQFEAIAQQWRGDTDGLSPLHGPWSAD
jgi:gamma-glutamylcyclotransferase (GGCT)/AIG2-like uncharacterized protein YtfP